MLPLDADDELLPDAIERMVSSSSRSPDIGSVYPMRSTQEIDRLRPIAGLQPVAAHGK